MDLLHGQVLDAVHAPVHVVTDALKNKVTIASEQEIRLTNEEKEEMSLLNKVSSAMNIRRNISR